MLVLKFGGTSVGSVENMINVKNIINDGQKKVVVLSAMSGTTNALVNISEAIKTGQQDTAQTVIDQLKVHYANTINTLLTNKEINAEVTAYVASVFSGVEAQINQPFTALTYNTLVAQGELLSTFIFSRFLMQEGINASLLPALDFMCIDDFFDYERSFSLSQMQLIC